MPADPEPTAPPKSWRDVLAIHPAAELFPPLPRDELKALGEDIKANGMHMPVTLLHQQRKPHFVLLDGISRLDALEMVGLDVPALLRACEEGQLKPELCIEYVTEPGVDSTLTEWEADPYDYVRSVNDRRRHMTAAQRGEVADKLLKARPDLSDRAIAKTAQVDHTTVATRRRKLEAGGEIHHPMKRTGRDGKAQSVSKKKAALRPPKRITIPWSAKQAGRILMKRWPKSLVGELIEDLQQRRTAADAVADPAEK